MIVNITWFWAHKTWMIVYTIGGVSEYQGWLSRPTLQAFHPDWQTEQLTWLASLSNWLAVKQAGKKQRHHPPPTSSGPDSTVGQPKVSLFCLAANSCFLPTTSFHHNICYVVGGNTTWEQSGVCHLADSPDPGCHHDEDSKRALHHNGRGIPEAKRRKRYW